MTCYRQKSTVWSGNWLSEKNTHRGPKIWNFEIFEIQSLARLNCKLNYTMHFVIKTFKLFFFSSYSHLNIQNSCQLFLKMSPGLDSAAVSIFDVILVELTNVCQFNQYNNKYWDGSAVYEGTLMKDWYFFPFHMKIFFILYNWPLWHFQFRLTVFSWKI